MRKFSFFLILCTALVVLTGCKKKVVEERGIPDIPPPMEVSANDTTAVYELTNKFLDCMREKRLDDAIAMLHYLKNGEEIVSLPPSLEKQNRMVLGNFLGLEYKIDNVVFFRETDSQVRFSVTLFEDPDANTLSRQNKVSFFLKPVRREGKWYLTLADSQSDSTHGTEIPN